MKLTAMRTIIVPISFGNNALNAAYYAVDLAMVVGAELHLLYTVPLPNPLTRHPMPNFVYEEIRDSGYTLLGDLCAQLKKRTAGKGPITTVLETGDVPGQLEALCRRIHPFLVVMGAGESLPEEPGNSNTFRAMHKLPYPLLIVPPNAVFHGVRHMAIACDEEDIYSGMTAALPFLKDINQMLGVKFDVVHVLVSGRSAGNAMREYDGWKSQLEAFGRQLHIIRQNAVDQGIQYFLTEHPVDWLLVLPKKHALLEFHKSKARDIALTSPVPVMSLHE